MKILSHAILITKIMPSILSFFEVRLFPKIFLSVSIYVECLRAALINWMSFKTEREVVK